MMPDVRQVGQDLPINFQRDIHYIETVLMQYGAQRIILYGSLARGDYRTTSDIDICVDELPPQHFFRALATCLMQIDHPFSIIDLANTDGYLRERILTEGKVIAMSFDKFTEEVSFGLENLEKIYQRIVKFSGRDFAEDIVIAALAYECLGYYNALEHLMIRILKYLTLDIPSGGHSHKETLRLFKTVLQNKNIPSEATTISPLENLMAFRHVATHGYSTLIDGTKLKYVVADVLTTHTAFKTLFETILLSLTPHPPGETSVTNKTGT